jgi:predicted nucleic acid-binding protein
MVISISVFIDSNVFVAFVNTRDAHHERARKIMQDILSARYGRAVTSDYVFDECMTATLMKTKDLESAVKLGRYMLDSEIGIMKLDGTMIRRAWKIFSEDNKERISFTDCTIRACMEMLGIEYVATFDQAFCNLKTMKIVC